MARIAKDLSTHENRRYWKFVEKTARQVSKWPKWLGGETLELKQ